MPYYMKCLGMVFLLALGIIVESCSNVSARKEGRLKLEAGMVLYYELGYDTDGVLTLLGKKDTLNQTMRMYFKILIDEETETGYRLKLFEFRRNQDIQGKYFDRAREMMNAPPDSFQQHRELEISRFGKVLKEDFVESDSIDIQSFTNIGPASVDFGTSELEKFFSWPMFDGEEPGLSWTNREYDTNRTVIGDLLWSRTDNFRYERNIDTLDFHCAHFSVRSDDLKLNGVNDLVVPMVFTGEGEQVMNIYLDRKTGLPVAIDADVQIDILNTVQEFKGAMFTVDQKSSIFARLLSIQ